MKATTTRGLREISPASSTSLSVTSSGRKPPICHKSIRSSAKHLRQLLDEEPETGYSSRKLHCEKPDEDGKCRHKLAEQFPDVGFHPSRLETTSRSSDSEIRDSDSHWRGKRPQRQHSVDYLPTSRRFLDRSSRDFFKAP